MMMRMAILCDSDSDGDVILYCMRGTTQEQPQGFCG